MWSLAGLAGEAVVPAAMAQTPAPRATQGIRPFIKMRGALDQRLVIGFLSGRYAGVVDGQVTPLFGLTAATFARYRPRDDGFEVVGFEQAYFTDLGAGEVLDRFTNPYTGETVAVPVTSLPPTKSFIGPNLRFAAPPNLPPNVSLRQSVDAPERIGDELIYVEHLDAVRAADHGKRAFRYSETTTLRANVGDVENPALVHAPCQTSFVAVVDWRPWLNMGDHPGAMLGAAVGGYGTSLEALPAAWLKATARLRPDLLSRPGASLDPLFN
jgi:hypothetical protein